MRGVLEQVGWRPADVQLIAVTLGPGSFTGLRVGITSAKTLAYATGASLIGVNTLAALAEQVPCDAEQLFAVIDAGRQELYVGQFARDGGHWLRIGPGSIQSIDAWLAGLPRGAIVTGPALAKLASRLPADVTVAPASNWKLMATTVGRVGWRHYETGQRDDPFQLTPLYLRRSAAEEKADEQAAAAAARSGK
jgi:tRNA threonylcarbamoyladenosine biosynthesis protein TsaB